RRAGSPSADGSNSKAMCSISWRTGSSGTSSRQNSATSASTQSSNRWMRTRTNPELAEEHDMTTTDTAADYSTLRLDIPEGVQTISMTRDFASAPDRVFRAHVDPELFVRWCGPDTITNTIREWNPTTGG